MTGGAGFIGANFAEFLLSKPDKEILTVTVYDKLTYAGNLKNLEECKKDPRFKLIVGDICDRRQLEESMAGHDYVIHFAAESHVDRSIDSAEPFILSNVYGTLNILEAARLVNIETIVHVSTDEVYGSVTEGAADENFPLKPNSPYAASKAASDLLARSFFITHGLDVRITRCSNNFGKYQHPEKFIPVVIRNAFDGREIPVYGNGDNIREWIHVKEHCAYIYEVLTRGKPGEIYNIGTNQEFANIVLANKICQILDASNELIKFVQDRKGHDFRYSVNSEKIRKLVEIPVMDFDSALKETISWYLSNSEWW